MKTKKKIRQYYPRMRRKKLKKCKKCGDFHSGIERYAFIFRCRCGRAIMLECLDDEGGGNSLGVGFPCEKCGRRWDLKISHKMTARKGFVQRRMKALKKGK